MRPILALLCLSAFGADHYVRSGASGTGTGADWTNACTDFAGSCAVASLVRGDTYYVADGTYAGRTFNTAASGASLITIKKATTSSHGTETGWDAAYGDGQAVFSASIMFSSDYWLFDGQERTSLTSGHGFKIDKNTTPDSNAGIYVGDPFAGGGGTAANYVTIQYFEVAGSADRTAPKVYSDHGVQALITNQQTNGAIRYFYIHDSGGCSIKAESWSTMLIEHGYMARNHSTEASHSEGIAIRTVDGLTIRHNWIVDIEGTAYIATAGASSGIGLNWYIYGNVFMRTPGNPYSIGGVGNGAIYFLSTAVSGDILIYNNTTVNLNDGADAGGIGKFELEREGNDLGNVRVKNNLWYNCRSAISTCSTCDTFEWTHNSYFDQTNSTDTDGNAQVGSGSPFVSASDLHLATNTSAWTALGSPYNVDLDGVTRNSSRGAYEYAAPPPPTTMRSLAGGRGAVIK